MTDLHISNDGAFFASAGADRTVKLWNYDEGSLYYTGEAHSGAVLGVKISPDEKTIVRGRPTTTTTTTTTTPTAAAAATTTTTAACAFSPQLANHSCNSQLAVRSQPFHG